MEYRQLGSSGLKVSQIGLGGNPFGWFIEEGDSSDVVNKALELGINFIDTADIYDQGRSETFLGNILKGRRSEVLIATKFGGRMGDGPNDSGGSRAHIMDAIEASLQRLQTDYVDLYQIHFFDNDTPLEETLRALDDLVRSGKVRYIGCSNFAAWQLSDALGVSKANSLNAFVSVQPEYNLLNRRIEKDLIPCCEAHNIGIVPYQPLAGGFLTGKYRPGEPPPEGTRLANRPQMANRALTEQNFEMLSKLETFASERGHTVGELALAWLLSRPTVSSIIAGTTKPEQVEANVAAAEWQLTPEEVAEVDEIAKPQRS
jgi:aryl-alcohol dehydrogenase-like predicted oxidoreductase